jgi:ATP-dependent Clp protease ATP-binding subunit ClpA
LLDNSGRLDELRPDSVVVLDDVERAEHDIIAG